MRTVKNDPWPHIPSTSPGAFDVFHTKIRELAEETVSIPLSGNPTEIALSISMNLSRFSILAEMADVDGTSVCNSPKLWSIFVHLSRVTYKLFKKSNVMFTLLIDLDTFVPFVNKLRKRFHDVRNKFELYISIFLTNSDIRHLDVVLGFVPVSYHVNQRVLAQIPTYCSFRFFDRMEICREQNVLAFVMQYADGAGAMVGANTGVSDLLVYQMNVMKLHSESVAALTRVGETHTVGNAVVEFLNAQRSLEKIIKARLTQMELDMESFRSHLHGRMMGMLPEGTSFVQMRYNVFQPCEGALYEGPIFKPKVTVRGVNCCLAMALWLRRRYRLSDEGVGRVMSTCLLLDDACSILQNHNMIVFRIHHDDKVGPSLKIL